MNRRVEHPETVDGLPRARVEKSRLRWWLWLVPLGAALLCVWFVYRDFVATGPTITIRFQSVEGLEANNTQLKYRGAQVGRVKSIDLAPDKQYVRVKAQLVGSAANLARVGSTFWIVRPELRLGSISGLRTIVSGEYITVAPGNGVRTNQFLGAENAPVQPDPGSLQVIVLAQQLDSVRVGSPVLYRGIQVGEILKYQLGPEAQDVGLFVMIRREYAPLLRRNSVFWNAGGLDFSVGLFRGFQLSAGSPSTLVTGGIEFATPPDYEGPVSNGAAFRLYDKPKNEWKAWAPAIRLNLPQETPQTEPPLSSPARGGGERITDGHG